MSIVATEPCIAMAGNPNAGKTLLFNRLTGLRAQTANYPGVTVDFRKGSARLGERRVELIDLPGLYSLDPLSAEEQVARDILTGDMDDGPDVSAVLLVLDATQLQRNLFLASEILELHRPTVVALNLIDAARSSGAAIDCDALAAELKCPVIAVSAKTGEGIEALKAELAKTVADPLAVVDPFPCCTTGCSGCHFAARFDWAEKITAATSRPSTRPGVMSAAIDRVLTHAVWGVVAFIALMLAVFYMIFSFASLPMDLVDGAFADLSGWVEGVVPAAKNAPILWTTAVFSLSMLIFWVGYRLALVSWNWLSSSIAAGVSAAVACLPADGLRSLLADGVVAGVGGMLIFLPQICILFFFLSLLEDSGYMARAAFVMERLMRRVGLPGKAFVPMLSAHACAIPGIMSTRVIENWRDRLTTILVLPLLTCSARLPVYAMIAALLFSASPIKAALVFVGAYLLGIVAALISAWLLKKTILPGEAEPLVIELPAYRLPSLRNALLTVLDRAIIFVRQAGTVILVISVVLWALASYPKIPASEMAQIEKGAAAGGEDAVGQRVAQAEIEYSVAGRVGRWVEPVFAPLGFDWQINIGVMTSFAAREVVVSTLAIVYGIGEDAAEDKTTLIETLRRQKRPDGSPVFTTATSLSFLVFFVLAMQCLPTQAVTRRETGSWRWAIFQFTFMSCLAYLASLVTYQVCHLAGLG
ncbi:MAG: ferrous iron transporter B [Planctomycetota bacterium]|nr:ferrous iron transporter B [Planctomycetota bacterium]